MASPVGTAETAGIAVPCGTNSRFYRSPHHLEDQPVLQRVGVDAHVIAMEYLSIQNLDGQRILDQTLDSSLQRTSTVLPIVSGQHELVAQGGR